ncbi:sclerostin domain-containing protein 1-like [Schistocerca gregaria]|uniref:sclerostin domain-containing protein 1-like n=1 Tax=Schistocerca gregaria TaxID=7010 RepID=UPI00211E4CE5|nr:sclerostin domain-containing protein 1-like [Schistocerca gregaria]
MLHLATLLVAATALSLTTQSSTALGNETASLSAAAGRGAVEEACPSLRSKRFISDGLCSSPYPVHEVVCADRAPSHGRRRKQQQQQSQAVPAQRERQRCVEGATRRRRVELLCQDGSRRFYHVRLVKSCRPRSQRRHRRPPEAAGL